jgi:diguanylate cyclase (GGDEF)-like protein/putative nucleotidyltransferase with HDIG domain
MAYYVRRVTSAAVARARFGDPARPPREVLLTIVFGVLLVVVGVTATAQALMVSTYATATSLHAIVESDLSTVRGFAFHGLGPEIIEDRGLPPAGLAELQRLLNTIVSKDEILQVELRFPDGHVIAASDPAVTGTEAPRSTAFDRAVESGTVEVELVDAATAELAPGSTLAAATLLREYLPLRLGDEVAVVVAVWRDAGPIIAALGGLRRDVVVATITAALLAAAVLFLVFRSAQGRLTRQSRALVEASRLDPLTRTLNHGALVGTLTTEAERARADGSRLGIALIDIDGFRALNDTHGHEAGDMALQAVVSQLQAGFSADAVMGRYGPDEFLLISSAEDGEGLQPAVTRFVEGLAGRELRFDETERLPITVSVALATYPTHGAAVTTLLASAAQTLDDAKASGGSTILLARTGGEVDADSTSSFDVLKGLILAVDTKDHYTKRHSEDVARYAVFIAERLGLDDESIRSIQVAGLLHDVGKIGIPDQILRKPGRLTAGELDVIAQHVALGEMIVRELPDIERVRDGIRNHHERWDGRGYLAGLSGEEIPLIGRILAVADSFSAMTTTRPYRKALDLKEALARLGDAAGTQLDERLVQAFLDGLEQAPNPPLPGTDVTPAGLWLAVRRAA